MTEKIISLAYDRYQNTIPVIPVRLDTPTRLLVDRRARPLQDLRISLTERCNFRCVYCMPKEVFNKDYRYLPHSSLLTFEEITRIASLFVAHSVKKIRLTGGEPLLRKNVEHLIAMLAALRTPDGRDLDLTLTTNGSLLALKAQSLKDAGLKRVTVSLDALDDAVFKKMNDVDFAVCDVLHGLQVAHDVGLRPIKINMVVKRGMNDQQILPMAQYFKDTPFVLRFIEYMDVGASNGWKIDEVITSAEVVRRIGQQMPLVPVAANYTGETANRWRYTDGGGEIGVISSITQAFCSDCTRARLSTEGNLHTCLFATGGHDLRALLRTGRSDAEIFTVIDGIWRNRDDRYSELRTANTNTLRPERKIEMSYIGG